MFQHIARFYAGTIYGLPAKTGSDNNNNTAVIRTAHTNNGNLCIVIPGARMFTIVVIKFIAPNMDDTPAKCRLNIPKSTAPPEWYSMFAIGGYQIVALVSAGLPNAPRVATSFLVVRTMPYGQKPLFIRHFLDF
jgi:hypothetical protein